MKTIPDFPDYLISFNGDVWSNKSNRWLKQSKISSGYLRVILTKDKKHYHRNIHRLLAEAYIPKIEGCNIINHLDMNRQNNSLSNLEWTTPRGNSQNKTNQSVYGHNITVDKRRKNISYRVHIQENGKTQTKSFKIHSEAIIYRDIELTRLKF